MNKSIISFELNQNGDLMDTINDLLVLSLSEILNPYFEYFTFEDNTKIKNRNIDRMISLLESIKIKEL